MKFSKTGVPGLVLGCVMAAAAMITTVGAQQEYSAEHLARTKEVVESLQVLNSFDQILPSMAERTRTLFVQNNPSIADEIENSVNQIALSLVDKRKDLDEQVIDIWAKTFSEEEITEIAAFFTSPAGQAFARKSGDLLQDSAVAAKIWGDERSVEIVELVRADLRRKGLIE